MLSQKFHFGSHKWRNEHTSPAESAVNVFMVLEQEWPQKTVEKSLPEDEKRAENVSSSQSVENNFSRLRLGGRQDFQRIQRVGRSFKISDWLILAFVKKSAGQIRVGWTVPRYVGNAVMRNRLKRWIRESLRSALPQHQNICVDVNFIFLNRGPLFYKGLNYEGFNASIRNAINKLEIMGSRRT